MTFTFPPLQWFETGTTSYLVLLISLWVINIGLIGSIVGLWILKPRARSAWLMAEVFWVATLLSTVVFIAEPVRFRVFRYLNDLGQTTLFVIACFAFPAIVAGTAELASSKKQSRGFRTRPIWVLMIPCSAFIMLSLYQQSLLNNPRGAIYRHGCQTNLKQIGLAMQNFHDTYITFPDSRTNLLNGMSPCPERSWRVELLPFMDHIQDFNAYDRASAWDSKKNLRLAMRPMSIYTCPTVPPSDHRDTAGRWYSAYSVLVGPDTAFPNGRGLRQGKFSDGLSNTALVVEACGEEIIWTEPRDLTLPPNQIGINLPGNRPRHSSGTWSSYHTNGAFNLMADGSVRFLSKAVDTQVLRAITTPNGGESSVLE